MTLSRHPTFPPSLLAVEGSLKDLARRLGLSHESLYRTLAKMQKTRVLARQGGRLRLLVQNATGL